MTIRIIVNGAHGKMGALASEMLRAHPAFDVVATLGRGDALKEAIHATDASVVLELTRADCVYENTLTIINSGAHPVIGTSGLLDHQITELTARCHERQLGALIVPNFSIAACLMMRFAAEAAALLPDVEIIEAHHPQKLDAPSGTALKTAELIASARRERAASLPLKEILPGARGSTYHDVHIHALRLPGVLAKQQVIFGNLGETLTITHESIDRKSFMPGVVLACERVVHLNTLHYGLDEVLNRSL